MAMAIYDSYIIVLVMMKTNNTYFTSNSKMLYNLKDIQININIVVNKKYSPWLLV